MGRPKGSKNKVTKARGPAKKYAVSPKTSKRVVAVKAAAKMPKAVKRAKPKAAPSEQYNELTGMILELARTQRLMLATLTTILGVHKAGFVDAWLQFVENSLKNDREPYAEDFIQLFSQTTRLLGLGVAELNGYLNQVTVVPTPEAPPAPEPVDAPVVNIQEFATESTNGHSLNLI